MRSLSNNPFHLVIKLINACESNVLFLNAAAGFLLFPFCMGSAINHRCVAYVANVETSIQYTEAVEALAFSCFSCEAS